MEFHIHLHGARPNPEAIDAVVRALDPAAMVDIDPAGAVLRVTTVLGVEELAACLSQAGYPVASSQVEQMPSVCCGGCSG